MTAGAPEAAAAPGERPAGPAHLFPCVGPGYMVAAVGAPRPPRSLRRPALLAVWATLALALGGTGLAAAQTAGTPATAAAASPTLGLKGAVNGVTEGFGSRRPREINYGGDPTSFATHIHWTSWGGRRAIGHGRADWVWPGWCVACAGKDLRATVVAFDRTTCGGHLAYARVEWYFPTRGMTFERSLAGTNLCTGKLPPASSYHSDRCSAVALGGGHRAHDIVTTGPPLRCPEVRSFLAGADLVRHLGHSTKFVRDGWYCGSQIFRAGARPQAFACERGDYLTVIFELS